MLQRPLLLQQQHLQRQQQQLQRQQLQPQEVKLLTFSLKLLSFDQNKKIDIFFWSKLPHFHYIRHYVIDIVFLRTVIEDNDDMSC